MRISLVHTYRCPLCAHREYGVLTGSVRITADSVVPLSRHSVSVPCRCKECLGPIAPQPERVDIDPDDQVRVDAYRVRRGWVGT